MNLQIQNHTLVSRNTNPSAPDRLAQILEAEKAIAAMDDADFRILEIESAANPGDGFLQLWRGLALAARRRDQEASDAYVKAIEGGCRHWRVGWYLAHSARRLGQLAIVDQCCAQVLKLSPEFWYAREFPKHARGYYAQMDQDRVLEEYFATAPALHKTFVEVGAFDGVHYSNVRRLHEQHGWTGVCVEPIQKNFEKLSRAYAGTSVKCIHAAVSNVEGELEMNVSTYPHLPDWGSDVASISDEGTERWKRQYGAQWTKEKVPAKKLTTILNEAGVQQIDVLSVDAEGHDLEVLESLDFSRFQPQVIVVEFGSQRSAMAGFLAHHGYSLLQDNNQDLIAARFQPLPMTGFDLPPTKNFTGLTGTPGYNEIQKDMELRLNRWLGKPAADVKRIVIVGGYFGYEIQTMLQSYPQAEIHVFEPSRRYFPKLQATYAGEPRVKCHQIAVSDQDGAASFNEGSLEGVGSLLPLKTQSDTQSWIPDNFRPAESYQVPIVTLDHFAPLQGQKIDLLWCDVQGAELKVLAGARATLQRTQALFLEVAATKTTYHGQCKLGELNLQCRDHGFYLAGIGLCPTGNGTGNALWLRAGRPTETAGHAVPVPQPAGNSGPKPVAPSDWHSKVNQHLLDIRYLPADARPVAKTVPALTLVVPERFDLGAKTLYVRHRLLNVQSDWAKRVYCEHISAFSGGTFREGDGRKNDIADYLKSFDSLIDSIRSRRFDPNESLVPCGRDGIIIDGSHRVAACAMLGSDVSVLGFDREANRYDSDWFRSRGLSAKTSDALALEYCRLCPETYMVMVFPAAQGKHPEVKGILGNLGRIVYEKQVELNRQGSFNLTRQVYAGEPWLGNWRNSFVGAWGKANPCFAKTGPLRVFVFQTDAPEKVRAAKQQIRALFGIENHSVHINDTHAQTLQLAQILLNDNSLHFLNHAQPKFFEKFERQLEVYRAWLQSSRADADLFCIDGSAVMAAYGLRPSADLDILHLPPADFSAVEPLVNSHNTEIHHHVVGRDEIIFNPENHFYFNGLKFAALDIIRRLKVKRNEGKDRIDVELIDTLPGAHSDKGPHQSPVAAGASDEAKALAGLPQAAVAFVEQAQHLSDQGKLDAALVPLEQALEIAPECVELLVACGALHTKLGRPGNAIECMKKACALRPGAPSLLAKLAALHVNAGQIQEFESVMARALSAGPEDPEVLGLFAELHVRQGDFAQAAKIYKTIIASSPRHLDTWLAMGRCFTAFGDMDGARAAYAQVLTIDSTNPMAVESLKLLRARTVAVQSRPPGAGHEDESFAGPSVSRPPTSRLTITGAKIVGLLPARNESQRLPFCLRAMAKYTDAIVYLDDCSDDDSVAVVESLAEECHVERIIRKQEWRRDEPGDRNAMLNAGRDIKGTHFIVLDADEAFTANCLQEDFLRRHLLNLRRGERLALTWIQLWRSAGAYRFDDSVWTYNAKPFAFCDDGQCSYNSGFIHTPRVPDNLRGRTIVIGGYVHGVLHFQFVNWRNLQIKQAWYRCLERIRRPDRPIGDINAQYAPSEDETGLVTRETPPDWFMAYDFFDPRAQIAPDERRLAEVRRWFQEYGQSYFAGLNIWHVDWGMDAVPNTAMRETAPATLAAAQAHGNPVIGINSVRGLIPALDQGNETARQLSRQTRIIAWQYEGLECYQHERITTAETIAAKLAAELGLEKYCQLAPLPELDCLMALLLGLAAEWQKDWQRAWDSYTQALGKSTGGICGFRLALRLMRLANNSGKAEVANAIRQQLFSKLQRTLPPDLDLALEEKSVLDWPGPMTTTAREVSGNNQERPEASGAPLVTAIVSTYKSERFLRGCLEDLEAQTIASQLEIIVVDSHSPQNERAIVEEFQRRYSNIVYIRTQERETVYGAWNRGARAAHGKYLTNANTDDRHRADALELLAHALDEHPDISLVYADCLVTEQENETYDAGNPNGCYHWLDFNARDLWVKGCFAGPQPMWRRDVHEEHGYFDAEMISAGDYEFWLRLAQNRKFLHVHTTLGLYLKSPTSVEHANREVGSKEVKLARARYQASIINGEPPFHPQLADPTATVEILIDSSKSNSSPAKAAKEMPAVAQIGHLLDARKALENKEYETAWVAAAGAIGKRPSHPEAFLLLAEIALAIGDGKSARRLAEQARDLAPGWEAVRQFLDQPLKGSKKPSWLRLAAVSPAHDSPRITACLIVKNEEQYLARCLKSIRELCAQMVVVDTGSTDHTIEVARECGAEVHSFAWCDDFAAARNVALEHATGDWILILDADEELPAAEHSKLQADLKGANSTVGFRLPLVNAGKEKEGRCFVPRLFRNLPGAFFAGRIHEQIFASMLESAKKWGLQTRLGTAEILHHGYSREMIRDRNKIERNLKLLQTAISENPTDPNLFMNLGLELVRSGELQAGLAKYREAYQMMLSRSGNVPELREALLTQFSSYLFKAGGHAEVVEILNSPLAQRAPLTASLHFALGLAYFESKQFREAADQMRQCLAKRKEPCLTPIVTDVQSTVPYHCLAACLSQLGDRPGAEQAFIAALSETDHLEPVKLDYAKFLQTDNRLVDALHQLHDVVTLNPLNVEAWTLGGEITLEHGEFVEFGCDWTSEALKVLPDNPVIAAHRAEALMLHDQPAEAAPFWDKIRSSEPAPRPLAALILCEVAAGQASHAPSGNPDEKSTSIAFVQWYQKLIAVHSKAMMEKINGRLDVLEEVLPTAAQMIRNALSEPTPSVGA